MDFFDFAPNTLYNSKRDEGKPPARGVFRRRRQRIPCDGDTQRGVSGRRFELVLRPVPRRRGDAGRIVRPPSRRRPGRRRLRPPCQEAAVALCDELSAEAELLKAVTTARVRGDAVEGFNVDVYAFGRALEELAVDVTGTPALILGVGATPRACGLALERARANVTYAARELTRPRPGLSSHATVIRTEDVPLFLTGKRPALLVDARTAGPTEAGPPPFDYDVIPPGCFVFDAAYDRRTPLLQAAEEKGLRHADGLTMLLFAAERAFALWTGLDASLDVMRRAATTELEKRKL